MWMKWFDEYLMGLRAKRQLALGVELIHSKYSSWQAEMVLRYCRDEIDVMRQLKLQDLALAMIYEEERLNPPNRSPEMKAVLEKFDTQLMGLAHIIEKDDA